MRRTGLVIGIIALTGCTQAFSAAGKAAITGTAAGSPIAGTATLKETPQGLSITVRLSHVPPGQHGLHVHEHGACGDSGKAAGGHFNPDNVKHGYLPKDGLAGAHAGDLGNITIGPDGSGKLTATIHGLTLKTGPHAVAGHAIILHEKVDDFSQPTGNAGARIGCGVIELVE